MSQKTITICDYCNKEITEYAYNPLTLAGSGITISRSGHEVHVPDVVDFCSESCAERWLTLKISLMLNRAKEAAENKVMFAELPAPVPAEV